MKMRNLAFDYEPQSEDEAMYAILYAIIAADGNATDEELKEIREPLLQHAPELESVIHAIHERVFKVQEILGSYEVGSYVVIDKCIPLVKQLVEKNQDAFIRLLAKLCYAHQKKVIPNAKADKPVDSDVTKWVCVHVLSELNLRYSTFYVELYEEERIAKDREAKKIAEPQNNYQKLLNKSKNWNGWATFFLIAFLASLLWVIFGDYSQVVSLFLWGPLYLYFKKNSKKFKESAALFSDQNSTGDVITAPTGNKSDNVKTEKNNLLPTDVTGNSESSNETIIQSEILNDQEFSHELTSTEKNRIRRKKNTVVFSILTFAIVILVISFFVQKKSNNSANENAPVIDSSGQPSGEVVINNPVGNKDNEEFIPKPVGYVSDFDSIFSNEQIEYLDSKLEDYETKTTTQICVVTLRTSFSTLKNFEDFSLKLINTWRVGQTGVNNGVLIVIDTKFHRLRIENGYGIEKVLSNDETKKIIDSSIIKSFKDGDYFLGTVNGINELIKKLGNKNFTEQWQNKLREK